MEKYEILEHEADLKIKAFGRTKEEIFLNMLIAMADAFRVEKKEQKYSLKEIKIKSLDLATLLVDFLNEVLYLTQVNREIYERMEFTKLSNNELGARVYGRSVGKFGEEVKAATYHGLVFNQKSDNAWEAIVIFDV